MSWCLAIVAVVRCVRLHSHRRRFVGRSLLGLMGFLIAGAVRIMGVFDGSCSLGGESWGLWV